MTTTTAEQQVQDITQEGGAEAAAAATPASQPPRPAAPEKDAPQEEFVLLSELLQGFEGEELTFAFKSFYDHLSKRKFKAVMLDDKFSYQGEEVPDELVLHSEAVKTWHEGIPVSYRLTRVSRDATVTFDRKDAQKHFQTIASKRVFPGDAARPSPQAQSKKGAAPAKKK